MKKYNLIFMLLSFLIACSHPSGQSGRLVGLIQTHPVSVPMVLPHIPAGDYVSPVHSLVGALLCPPALLLPDDGSFRVLLLLLFVSALGLAILVWRNNRLRTKIALIEQQLKLQTQSVLLSTAANQANDKLQAENDAENAVSIDHHPEMQSLLFLIIGQYRNNICKKRKDIHPFDAKIDNPAFFSGFVRCMDLVYNNISQRLKAAYPCLSERDILICCMVLGGFDSGMMASVLDIHVDSVVKCRQRIRARLEIKTPENLLTFLKNF